jgi:uncharacterized surface protein with fasciclin (FAS1) repeats
MTCFTRPIALTMLGIGALAYKASRTSSWNREGADDCKNMTSWMSECCSEENVSKSAKDTVGSTKDIVDTAAATGTFSTLVKAVEAANLVDVLKEGGTFTVFAPTNEAFDRLEDGVLEDLLKPENQEKLQAILTYHVVPGKLNAEDVKKIKLAGTVQGKALTVTTDGETVKVDNAKIIQTDIECKNGVIHIIDAVVLPE